MDKQQGLNELMADLHSNHIEGIARMGGRSFKVPLFSQIDGNLWSGGCPVGTAPGHFIFIVSLYPWGKYEVQDHQVHTEATLFDSKDIPDITRLTVLADYVNLCRVSAPTLVHCQAGLNRSALVTCFALMRSGMEAAEAISLIRAKRSDVVLCNKHFENWLMQQ